MNHYAQPWPPDGERVVWVKAGHKGDPRLYTKQPAIITGTPATGYYSIQLEDGYETTVPQSRCTVSNPYAMRTTLARQRKRGTSTTPRSTRKETIDPKHGIELVLPLGPSTPPPANSDPVSHQSVGDPMSEQSHIAGEVPTEVAEDLLAYRYLNARIAELQELAKPLADRIKTALTDLEIEDALINGETVATYRTTKAPQRFDATAFKKAHPQLHAEFVKPGRPSRRFVLIGGGESDGS